MIPNAVFRTFYKNVWQNTSRNMASKLSTAEKIAAMTPNELVKNTVSVSEWNKRVLVFAGRFKTMAEIPNTLPFEVVDRAINKARIKVCNIMIVLTIIGCVATVIRGKRGAEAGESIYKVNRERHREYMERADAVNAAANKS